jgi:hypothetical protein
MENAGFDFTFRPVFVHVKAILLLLRYDECFADEFRYLPFFFVCCGRFVFVIVGVINVVNEEVSS